MKTAARRTALLVVPALVAVLVGVGRAEDKPKPKEKPKELTVMQRKLLHSQRVLEGLATGNFEKIATGSDGLVECVKDVTWKINETEKYLLHTNEFLRRLEALKKSAKDKNVDAAALAYVDMTITCVRCHQHLREDRPTATVPDLSALAPRR